MAGPIQSPIKGQPMRASWGAAVSSALNSLLPMGSDGLLARQGVAGTGFAALPANKRDRRAASVLPWSFSCTEDPDTHERTGGWTNCILQLGFNTVLYSEDITYITSRDLGGEIEGTDLCDDGLYFVEVNTIEKTAEIKIIDPSDNTGHDFDRGIVRIWIGTVEDGKMTHGKHQHPFVPLYAEG